MRKLKYVLGWVCLVLILVACNENDGETTAIPKQDNITDYLLYTSLSLNILCLVLIYMVHRHCQKLYNCKRNERPGNDIGNFIPESNIEDVVSRILERDNDIIADNVLKRIRLSEQENSKLQVNKDNQNISKVSKEEGNYLYASSADSDKRSFFKVTEQPDEDTIYKLMVSDNRAQFRIYSEANSKVLKAPDFLECACEIQKTGKEMVVTQEQGIAEKQADGSWIIINKAKIKFE